VGESALRRVDVSFLHLCKIIHKVLAYALNEYIMELIGCSNSAAAKQGETKMTASTTLNADKKLIFKVVASLCDGRDRADTARAAALELDDKHGMNVQTSAHWNDYFCEALDKYAD
jgi:hypothetical protein